MLAETMRRDKNVVRDLDRARFCDSVGNNWVSSVAVSQFKGRNTDRVQPVDPETQEPFEPCNVD